MPEEIVNICHSCADKALRAAGRKWPEYDQWVSLGTCSCCGEENVGVQDRRDARLLRRSGVSLIP